MRLGETVFSFNGREQQTEYGGGESYMTLVLVGTAQWHMLNLSRQQTNMEEVLFASTREKGGSKGQLCSAVEAHK